MERIDAIKIVAEAAKNGLIISNLGFPSRELYAVADSERNFYMLGSMGLASSIGLGLSVAQSKSVYVIDGDGSVLMNLGSLSTIGNYAEKNYYLIIIDNKSYATTGDQPTHTARRTRLDEIARGCGISVIAVDTTKELDNTLKHSGPLVIVAGTKSGNAEVPIIPFSPEFIKERFLKEVKRF
jgi:sulfopyruvate decarboxylase subunit beta